MAGDNHGDKTQEAAETAQDNRHEQATQEQPQVSGAGWERAVAERLRGEIAKLKAQGESDRIDFKL